MLNDSLLTPIYVHIFAGVGLQDLAPILSTLLLEICINTDGKEQVGLKVYYAFHLLGVIFI